MGIYVLVIRDSPEHTDFYRLEGATTIQEGKEAYFKILRKDITDYGGDSYSHTIDYINTLMRQQDVATFLRVEDLSEANINDFLFNFKCEMAANLEKQKEDKERAEFERLKKKYG